MVLQLPSQGVPIVPQCWSAAGPCCELSVRPAQVRRAAVGAGRPDTWCPTDQGVVQCIRVRDVWRHRRDTVQLNSTRGRLSAVKGSAADATWLLSWMAAGRVRQDRALVLLPSLQQAPVSHCIHDIELLDCDTIGA